MAILLLAGSLVTIGNESKAELGKKGGDDAHACRWQAAAAEQAGTCLMPGAVRNPGQLDSLGSRKKVLK